MKHCVRAVGGMNFGNSANIAFIRDTNCIGRFVASFQSAGLWQWSQPTPSVTAYTAIVSFVFSGVLDRSAGHRVSSASSDSRGRRDGRT